MIYDDIFKKGKIKEEDLLNKKYLIDKILDNNLIDKLQLVEELIPLISFILYSENKQTSDFFINLIDSKFLSENELKEKCKEFGYSLLKDEKELNLIANKIFYEKPQELCFNNLNDNNYEICEKYNFKYLIKNPPLKIDISKIKHILKIAFNSNVFKEAFFILTGKSNYENIFNNEMIHEIINNIKFLPINYSSTSAFLDCLSLITYIPTMKKDIQHNSRTIDKTVNLALENGIIIAIEYHVFGQVINTVVSFLQNGLKLNETPRKPYFNFREGGYYFELILFGKIIKNLTYGEALYILNENNYKKSLKEFKNGFMELSEKDLIIEGEFDKLNLNNNAKLNELKNSVSIKAKNGDDKNILNGIKINIPLKNDIIGRVIKEEDLEIYF